MKNVLNFAILGLVAIASLFGASGSASAATRITLDTGGSLVEYIEKYYEAKRVESKFIIDGPCISACTFITGIILRKNVCATERGVLAFHSASFVTGGHSEHGTRLMWQMYPRDVRAALKARGWDASDGSAHPDLIYIRAQQFYQPCPPETDFSGRVTVHTKTDREP